MRCLLFGARGQLGSVLSQRLASRFTLHTADRPEIDFTDAGAVTAIFKRIAPHLVVNCAAYTAVDRAQAAPAAARAANATAPDLLARSAAAYDALLVHFSTDYVFDGSHNRPYREDDLPAPLNVYGESKLQGEQAITAAGCAHLIFRTSWLYARHGRNFVTTVLQRARAGETLRIVDDQTGSPTSAVALADLVTALLSRITATGALVLPRQQWGLYHATCAGACSWFDLARQALELHRLDGSMVPIATADFPTPATRPRYSVLDNTKLQTTFGAALPHWRDALRTCFAAGEG